MTRIFSYGGKTVWMLISGFVVAAILSVMLLTNTAELRYTRDVSRMVYNDNLGVLNEVKSKLGMTTDSLRSLMNQTAAEAANQPYIVFGTSKARRFCFRHPSRLAAARSWSAGRTGNGDSRLRADD